MNFFLQSLVDVGRKNYRRIFVWLSLFFYSEIYAKGLFHRKDLESKLTSLACGENIAFTWRDFMRQGIYDANIVLQKLELKAGNVFNVKDVEIAAQQLAKQNFHNGFVFGSCSDKASYWIATMPATSPIYLDQRGLIQIPSESLFEFCSQSKIEFAQAGIGLSRMLFNLDSKKSYDQLQINSQFLNDGILSLSCVAREHTNLGPVLWSIFPIKDGPSQKVPYSEVFEKVDSVGELQTWVDWLNMVRKNLKLSPLKLSMEKPILDSLSVLLKSGSIFHDRKLNSRTRQDLRKHRLNMIGETRVISRDLEEASWLLWNSPSHRSLLTSQKANRISILKKTFSEDFLTVLIFSSLDVAKTSKKIKKP